MWPANYWKMEHRRAAERALSIEYLPSFSFRRNDPAPALARTRMASCATCLSLTCLSLTTAAAIGLAMLTLESSSSASP